MPTLSTQYEQVRKLIDSLSEAELLNLIAEIIARLQKKVSGNTHVSAPLAERKRTLADLQGLLKGLDISEEEILTTKYSLKDFGDL